MSSCCCIFLEDIRKCNRWRPLPHAASSSWHQPSLLPPALHLLGILVLPADTPILNPRRQYLLCSMEWCVSVAVYINPGGVRKLHRQTRKRRRRRQTDISRYRNMAHRVHAKEILGYHRRTRCLGLSSCNVPCMQDGQIHCLGREASGAK